MIIRSGNLTNAVAIVTYVGAFVAIAAVVGSILHSLRGRREKRAKGFEDEKSSQAKASEVSATKPGEAQPGERAGPPSDMPESAGSALEKQKSDDGAPRITTTWQRIWRYLSHDRGYWLTVIGGLILVGIGTGFTIFAEQTIALWQQWTWTGIWAALAFVTIKAATSKDGILTHRIKSIRHGVSTVQEHVAAVATSSAGIEGQVEAINSLATEIKDEVKRAKDSISEGANSIQEVVRTLEHAEKGFKWRANKARMVEQFNAMLLPGVGQIPTTYRLTVWGPVDVDGDEEVLIPLYLPVLDEAEVQLQSGEGAVGEAWRLSKVPPYRGRCARFSPDVTIGLGDSEEHFKDFSAWAAVAIGGKAKQDGEVKDRPWGVLSAIAYDNDGSFEGDTGIRRLQRVADTLLPLMPAALTWLVPTEYDWSLGKDTLEVEGENQLRPPKA